jgi:NodT family efflux transporter outer membrane factor (OMF) lipoprotein
LWGRVSRSIEVADANIAQQAALLDYARLSLLSEVARNYLELRTLQQQVVLYEKDIVALESLTGITEQRVKSGVAEALNLNLNLAELAALKANLPPLQAQIHTLKNSLALLLGELPGKLHEELTEQTSIPSNPLPELALGLPSQVVNRRPDIRAAEHQLHAATANIGVATANLYPSISLGAAFGFESYLAGELADWGSRSWSIGPVLNLPLFDHGRLKSRVQLRELEQQQAAVNFHQTVLKAWKEVDDTLFGYASIKQKEHELHVREENAFNHYNLVQSRYQAGLENFSAVLMSERQYLQARMASNENRGQLYTQYVMINKAIGNGPDNLSL